MVVPLLDAEAVERASEVRLRPDDAGAGHLEGEVTAMAANGLDDTAVMFAELRRALEEQRDRVCAQMDALDGAEVALDRFRAAFDPRQQHRGGEVVERDVNAFGH